MTKKELMLLEEMAGKYMGEKEFFDSLKEREKEFENLKKSLLLVLSNNENHVVTKSYNMNRIVTTYAGDNTPPEIKAQYKIIRERQSLQIVPAK